MQPWFARLPRLWFHLEPLPSPLHRPVWPPLSSFSLFSLPSNFVVLVLVAMAKRLIQVNSAGEQQVSVTCAEPVQQAIAGLAGRAAVRAQGIDTLLTGTPQRIHTLVNV